MTGPTQTLVSAPGKVLLAGGYLVLDPAYPGVVVATSSRFYSLVQSSSTSSSGSKDAAQAATIRVRSHQFVGAEWVYHAHASADKSSSSPAPSIVLTQSRKSVEAEHAGRNPFVGLALLYALRVAAEKCGVEAVQRKLGGGLEVFVMGDNDFYSQRETLAAHGAEDEKAPTTAALRSLAPFTKQSCPIRGVHKTGLGSSAAMTTSLVGALLVHLGAVTKGAHGELPLDDLAFVHNVAQLAHCAAQGKVGSGFDVSAAVWGSQIFRRFEPKVLDGLMGGKIAVEGEADALDLELPPLLAAMSPTNEQWRPSPLQGDARGGHPTAAEGMSSIISSQAKGDGPGSDQLVKALSNFSMASAPLAESSSALSNTFRPAPIALPPCFSLVLADVDAGSNTPSLVGKVLKWRKEQPAWADQLYTILASANQYLADCLFTLGFSYFTAMEAYKAVAEWAATVPSSQWEEELKKRPEEANKGLDKEMLSRFVDLRKALRSVRGGMRELGLRAGCPVEPDEMGKLISASVDGAPGIAGGGVPGAGGYDALYLVYVVPPSSLAQQQEDTSKGNEEREEAAAEASPARQAVEKVWAGWEGMSVGPLLSTAGRGLGLRVREVDEVPGVRAALGDWLSAS
ncbi:phosphomevalonate kinase [Tilletia horrida]|nr:phosphomevalonate kinase [Tilletia horrida]